MRKPLTVPTGMGLGAATEGMLKNLVAADPTGFFEMMAMLTLVAERLNLTKVEQQLEVQHRTYQIACEVLEITGEQITNETQRIMLEFQRVAPNPNVGGSTDA